MKVEVRKVEVREFTLTLTEEEASLLKALVYEGVQWGNDPMGLLAKAVFSHLFAATTAPYRVVRLNSRNVPVWKHAITAE